MNTSFYFLIYIVMEIQGKVIAMSDIVEFGEKNTQKRSFVVEYGGWQYPCTISIDAIADKVKLLDMVSVGEEVIAHINTKAKEYNWKRFNSISIWRVENMTRKPKPVVSDDLPF